ncbi:hypothetical protein PEDI_24730 [Persicobacter diffluens]|uniref:Uncharacterized protein n=1 Tax=Persicobacter diffluens TaxID=981 RepID=A0AAN4VZH5_9BACT|nr:hypothetical protein PEDI_24730 [Persicobacter diffluens]
MLSYLCATLARMRKVEDIFENYLINNLENTTFAVLYSEEEKTIKKNI